MPRIFILEDNPSMLAELQRLVEFDKHQVECATNLEEARRILGAINRFDLLILDWEVPDGSGVELCTELRAAGETSSVLMLTGKSLVDDKEMALQAGADDYLTKPFHLKELQLRIRGLLKRSLRPLHDDQLISRNLRIERAKALATVGETHLSLTGKEFALLELFMLNPDKVFTAEQLMNHAWLAEEDIAPDTVRTHIKNLRRKLSDAAAESQIETVHSVGYRFT